MKKRLFFGFMVFCLVLLFASSTTVLAVTPQISVQPVSATYYVGETPAELTASVEGVTEGYSVTWQFWVIPPGSISGNQCASGSGLTASCTPDTSTAGEYTYYVGFTIIKVGSQPQYLRTEDATITILESGASFNAYKTDDAANPLAGAVIQLVNVQEGDPNYETTTGVDGVAAFTGVTDGGYVLSEKTAPSGYTKSEDTYNIQVEEGIAYFQIMSLTHVGLQRYSPVTFVNTEVPLHTFEVWKTDENGDPLAGAIIRLEGITDTGIPRVYDETTDASGIAVFAAEAGTYTLSEYAAPSGYNATDDTYTIVINESGVFFGEGRQTPYETVTFVNQEIPQLNKDDHFAYMQGYPDGTFGPSRNMTRAEAVVMFSRLTVETMDLSTDYYDASYYPDVAEGQWYSNQVCYMYQSGVLADFSQDGFFRPDEPVTRAEFATLAAHFDDLVLTSTNIFSDVANDHWAVKYINSAAAKGWIEGYPDGTFKPEAYITRAEVVTLVNRILDREADQSYITANISTMPRSYSDISDSYWAYWQIMEASIGHDYTRDSLGVEHWTSVYE